jgi:hypothetical protein
VQNSFTGGKVGVGGSEYNAPYAVSNLHWEAMVSIDAVMDGRSHEGYVRRFQRWLKGQSEQFSTSKATNVAITDYTFSQTYTADFLKEFNIIFQNSFIGVGNVGTIKVSNEVRTSLFNYQLVHDGSVTLAIYDMQGRLVKTLVQGEKQGGYYGIHWDGVDETNSKVASGIYFYQFMAQPLSGKEPFRKSGKLLLAK